MSQNDDDGPTSPVRLDKESADKLRVICSIRKVSSAKLLRPVVRPFVEREYPKALKEAMKEADGA